jgi:hypothetical protein
MRDYIAMANRTAKNKENGFDYPVYFCNDVVLGRVIDTIAIIRASEIYRHEIKKLTNELEKKVRLYQRQFNNALVDAEAFSIASQYIDDEISADVTKLYYSIKNQLDKDKRLHTDVFAHAEVMMCMIIMSVQLADRLKKEGAYRSYRTRMTAILANAMQLCNRIYFVCGTDDTLSKTAETALTIIAHRFLDSDMIGRAMDAGVRETEKLTL